MGLKVNFNKSSFTTDILDYLGYHITREGITPIPKKIEAIKAIRTPKKRKKLCSFLGMINFYRDMWSQWASLLTLLSTLTSVNVKSIWKEEHQKTFEAIKRVLTREVLCEYPDFNKPFEMHTDVSKTQIGAIISQDRKPIFFYSRKLKNHKRITQLQNNNFRV